MSKALYKVGYSTEEESHYWEFEHDHALDSAEFLSVVKRCLLAASRTEEIKRAGDRGVSPGIADLFETAAFIEAMKSEEFRPAEYRQRVSLDGWAELDDDPCNTDRETREVLEFIAAEAK